MISKIITKDELKKQININDFIDSSVNGSVFACEWFVNLKNVNNFIVIEDNGEIVLIMPLFEDSSNCNALNQSTMYIPYGGPVIKSLPRQQRNKIRYLRRLNTQLIKTLKERYLKISFSTDTSITDIMPYIRAGFMPELRYTYKLDISNPDALYNNYGHDRRKEIRKANNYNLKFVIDSSLEFVKVDRFVEWESKYGFDSSVNEVREIMEAAIKNDNGGVFVAFNGNIVVGAVGMLWRNNTAYIMYSYYDKNYDCGTIAFLYDNIFKYLSKEKNVKVMYFEGSVYESVEDWNISFNAYQDRFYNLHYDERGNEEIARTMYVYFEK